MTMDEDAPGRAFIFEDEALNILDIDMDKYALEQGWDEWDYGQLSLELEGEEND